MSAPNKFERLDFGAINAALLSDVVGYASQWFGGGTRSGHNFFAPSTKSGGIGDSWSVSTSGAAAGRWMHGASGDSGGDMISLYAAIYSLTQIEAAKQLADITGCKPLPASSGGYAKPKAAPVEASKGEADKDEKPEEDHAGYELVCPVPADAPEPHKAHPYRGMNLDAVYTYYGDGAVVLGYIYRFKKSDGGKAPMPHTLWRNTATGALEWKWWVWSKPRPVYRPTAQTLIGNRHVIVVEGEKCALNLDTFLVENGCLDYDVVSWVGGTPAADKIDWSPLAGRTCILWPDADSKVKRGTTEFLPADVQAGQKAMNKVAQSLLGIGCAVSMIPLPDVGTLPDGWDCADAIDAGWGLDKVLAQVASATSVAKEPSRDAGLTQVTKLEGGFAPALPPELAWTEFLQRSKDGNIKPTRENAAAALRYDVAFAGAVKYNLFSNRVDVLRDLPWRDRGIGKAKMSEWVDFDSLHLGDYLCKTHFYPSVGSATLHEAVGLAASVNSYHPVRDGLERLKWDGVTRLDDWLIQAVCANPDALDPKTREYISLVGRYFIMGAVARVTDPGCKFDYCFVLKGDQGAGKSTLFSILGGAYFSDNKFKLDDAANMGLALAGRWFVEFAELAGLNRSEINDVKACITQQVDRYRPPFGKVVTDHPRQCVFCGSTNDDTPLRDPTGSRRFWVVEVTKPLIDNDYVRSVRLQLFAEALAAVKAGESYHPTYDQENVLFKPEQERHTRISPIYEQLLHLAGNEVGDWASKSEWTTAEVGMKLTGKGVDSVTPTLQQEIGSAMRRMGWQVKQKRVAGKVVRVYAKPANWGAVVSERSSVSESQKLATGVSPTFINQPDENDDDIPF